MNNDSIRFSQFPDTRKSPGDLYRVSNSTFGYTKRFPPGAFRIEAGEYLNTDFIVMWLCRDMSILADKVYVLSLNKTLWVYFDPSYKIRFEPLENP